MAPEIDMIMKRPRTPNDPYTILTDEQIRNIRQKPCTFFKTPVPPPKEPVFGLPREGNRYYKDRYVHTTSMSLLHDPKSYGNNCWIGDQLRNDLPVKYDSCRGMASAKWGPQKIGEQTRSHFFGENVDRYTTIDMYRRPVTSYTGRVVMDYGRPADGYYTQRFPNRAAWFRSSVKLNCTNILQSVHRKTYAEYEQIHEAEKLSRLARNNQWPEYSNYTDSYLLKTRTPVSIKSNLERQKMFRLEEERMMKMEVEEKEAERLAKEEVERNIYTAMARAACRPVVVAT